MGTGANEAEDAGGGLIHPRPITSQRGSPHVLSSAVVLFSLLGRLVVRSAQFRRNVLDQFRHLLSAFNLDVLKTLPRCIPAPVAHIPGFRILPSTLVTLSQDLCLDAMSRLLSWSCTEQS
jgi:hypothetical protein